MRRFIKKLSAIILGLMMIFQTSQIAFTEEAAVNEETVDKSSADFDVSFNTSHKFSGKPVTAIPKELLEPDLRGGVRVDGDADWDFTKPDINYGTNRDIAHLKWTDLGDGQGCYQYTVDNNNLMSQSVYSTKFAKIKPNRNYLISVLLWSDFTRMTDGELTPEGTLHVYVQNEKQQGGVDLRMGIPDNTNGWQRFEYVGSTGLMETAVSARLMLQTWNFSPGMPEGNIYIADFAVIELPEVTDVPVYAEGEGVTFRGGAGGLDMALTDAVETENEITVDTTGVRYVFDKNNDTITASQKIGMKRDVSSWKSSVPFKDLKIKSTTEKECVITCPEVTFGVQLDGMVFLTPHKDDIKLTCTSLIAGMWNKFAFGFLTVADDYGGFTVTPDLPEGTGKLCNYEVITENLDFTQTTFNNVLGLVDGKENPYLSQISNAKEGWQIAWTISPGERLAISTFPPREYEWEESFESTYRNMDWNSSTSVYNDDYNNFDVRTITLFNMADRSYASEWGPYFSMNAHESELIAHIDAIHEAGMKAITYAPAYFYFDKWTPDQYITEITRLSNRYELDGIYSDGTPSEHQWVTAYEESRMLRELFPDGTLVVHHTGNPENGGPPLSSGAHFIPAVDTYWNMTLKAESLAMVGLNTASATLTLPQYNLANVVGITKGDAWYYVDEEGKNVRVPQADQDLLVLEHNGRARITLHDEAFKTGYVAVLRQLKALWEEKGDEPNFYEEYYAPTARALIKDKLEKYGDIIEYKSDFSNEAALSDMNFTSVASLKQNGEENCLELRGARSYQSGSAFKRINSVSGPMSIEYEFMADERGDYKHSFSDNYDNPAVGLMFGEDGKLKIVNQAGNYVNITKYNMNQWYKVRVDIDTDKGVWALYLDDKCIKENMPLADNVYQISEMEFTDGGYGSVCCLNNIKVANKW